jgi:hypothetical protein
MPLIGPRVADGWALPGFLTYRSTEYLEADGSPEGAYAMDRGQITRHYHVDFAARDQAALDFAGTASVEIGGGGGVVYISRTTPHPLPNKPFMYCQSVPSIKPVALRGTSGVVNDGTGMCHYEMAEISCQYIFPTFAVKEDNNVLASAGPLTGYPDEGDALRRGHSLTRYITKVPKVSTRELVTNRGLLKSSDGKPILEGIPRRELVGEITYIWHQVLADALPQQAWVAGGCCVNEVAFDGWPAGTLCFSSTPELRPSPNVIDGKIYYDLSYKFALLMIWDPVAEVARGHNYVLRKDGSTLVPKLVTVSGNPSNDFTAVGPSDLMYRPFDFGSFFRPDQP